MRSERDLSYSLHALPKSERAYAELEHWRGRLVGEYPLELPRADAPYPGKMHDTLKGASTAPDPIRPTMRVWSPVTPLCRPSLSQPARARLISRFFQKSVDLKVAVTLALVVVHEGGENDHLSNESSCACFHD